jgi:anaerobic selenocysteine-containing dehydrogenase
VDPLRRLGHAALRDLGRLTHPLVWRTGTAGFEPVSWSALPKDLQRRSLPGRDWSVEALDRLPQPPAPLAPVLGVSGATCPLDAVLDAQVVVVWGADLASGQPIGLGWLHRARARGAKVIWVADDPGAGVVVTDLAVRTNDPGASARAVLRTLIDSDRLDHASIAAFTTGVSRDDGPAGHTELADALAGARVVSITAPDWAADVARVHGSQGALGRPGCGVIVWPGPGLSPLERSTLEACHAGQLQALLTGVTLRPRAPFPAVVDEALQRPHVRIHLTTHVAPEHLIPAQDAVYLLPVASVAESGGHVRGVDGRVVLQQPVTSTLPGQVRSVDSALDALGLPPGPVPSPEPAVMRCVDGHYTTPDGLAQL